MELPRDGGRDEAMRGGGESKKSCTIGKGSESEEKIATYVNQVSVLQWMSCNPADEPMKIREIRRRIQERPRECSRVPSSIDSKDDVGEMKESASNAASDRGTLDDPNSSSQEKQSPKRPRTPPGKEEVPLKRLKQRCQTQAATKRVSLQLVLPSSSLIPSKDLSSKDH